MKHNRLCVRVRHSSSIGTQIPGYQYSFIDIPLKCEVLSPSHVCLRLTGDCSWELLAWLLQQVSTGDFISLGPPVDRHEFVDSWGVGLGLVYRG